VPCQKSCVNPQVVEPRIIPKHQRRIPGFDDQILALYAKGMRVRGASGRVAQHTIYVALGVNPEGRMAITTTNAIESVNSVIRKLTRNRKIDPNGESALKLTCLAIQEASKWTMPVRNWKQALNDFAILYEDRLPV
jgi:transposase-like protein